MERLDYDDFEVVLEGHADGMTAQVATSPVGPSGRVPFVLLVSTIRAWDSSSSRCAPPAARERWTTR